MNQKQAKRQYEIDLLITLLLTVLVTISAIAVIYVKHLGIQLVSAIDKIDRQHDAIQEQWGQLLLEKGALTAHGRIERLAREKLSMTFPENRKLIRIARP